MAGKYGKTKAQELANLLDCKIKVYEGFVSAWGSRGYASKKDAAGRSFKERFFSHPRPCIFYPKLENNEK